MTLKSPKAQALLLSGAEAGRFLQSQVTCDVRHVTTHLQYTAICNLQGRIQFGLWLSRFEGDIPTPQANKPALPQFGTKKSTAVDPALLGNFLIIVTDDQAAALEAHLRKYTAFSAVTITLMGEAKPVLQAGQPSWALANNTAATEIDVKDWARAAITQGMAWITAETAEQFQPQELRLHQRKAVAYDKGCYLGQEIVARLYFRGQPKRWLFRIKAHAADELCPQPGQSLAPHITVVNAALTDTGSEALVVARPEAIEQSKWEVLPLPEQLSGSAARVD